MSNTINALEIVLDSVVEQLILAGEEPGYLLKRVLNNALWICESKLPEIAIDKISQFDDATKESGRWTNESMAWERNAQFDDVTWSDYDREYSDHQRIMSEFEENQDEIDKLAGRISKSAYQAQQLKGYLEHFIPDTQSRNDAIELVFNISMRIFNLDTSKFDEERFKKILRYLIECGGIGINPIPIRNQNEDVKNDFKDSGFNLDDDIMF